MLRTGGRYVLGGLVNPDANVTIDANMLVKRWVTMRGIHNYHPRHLIQALDFVMANRDRFPFKDIVDSKFALKISMRHLRKHPNVRCFAPPSFLNSQDRPCNHRHLNFTPRGLYIGGRWVAPADGKSFRLDQSIEYGKPRRLFRLRAKRMSTPR